MRKWEGKNVKKANLPNRQVSNIEGRNFIGLTLLFPTSAFPIPNSPYLSPSILFLVPCALRAMPHTRCPSLPYLGPAPRKSNLVTRYQRTENRRQKTDYSASHRHALHATPHTPCTLLNAPCTHLAALKFRLYRCIRIHRLLFDSHS
jgi:hypothetical protein